MKTIDAQASHYPASNVVMLRHRTRTWVIVSVFLGLGSLNILTLLSNEVHDVGYSAIRAILGSAVADATLSRVLSNSPTVKRQKDVTIATKALSDEKLLLSASNKALVEKHNALEKSHKEITAKHTELTRTSGVRALATKKFSKRLATRSVVNATRNLTSVPAEAIPIVGFSIVLAVTAWDLHDACETLKDINELNAVLGDEQEDQATVCGMKVPTKEEAVAQAKGRWKAVYGAARESLKKGATATVPAAPQSLPLVD